jgi:hypothetical protein
MNLDSLRSAADLSPADRAVVDGPKLKLSAPSAATTIDYRPGMFKGRVSMKALTYQLSATLLPGDVVQTQN